MNDPQAIQKIEKKREVTGLYESGAGPDRRERRDRGKPALSEVRPGPLVLGLPGPAGTGECLGGAVERNEPWGVWGGEIFERGAVVPRKRPRGRPRKADVARDAELAVEVEARLVRDGVDSRNAVRLAA
jgi:hypothetical protein